ncbi:MAG: hypothetical protein AMS16_06890 [Planctomycetes bacterium DG_58]|nr:MAG: hypothetical protein AMS16_06890 [Planctomycetes bacterium DG_58]
MLILRKEQLEALGRHSEKLFLDRMVDHVSEIFPEKCKELGSRGQIRELVRQGLNQARGYGINTEEDVALYVDITFGIGPDFPQGEDMSWARSILENERLSGTAKMAFILQRLEKRLGAEESEQGAEG